MQNQLATHSNSNGGNKHTWLVEKLWIAAKDLKPFPYSIKNFKALDEDIWFGGKNQPTVRNVLEHHKRVMNSDLNYPIILSETGLVMDGVHRICKAILEGKSEILAVQFLKNPPADKIEIEKPK